MVWYTLIILFFSHLCYAESFTVKRSPRRSSISSLQQELCTECSHIMQISPACIKKIIKTNGKDASAMIVAIADVQSCAIKIIQCFVEGDSLKMSRDKIEQAIIAAKSVHIALKECLNTHPGDTSQKLCAISNSFLDSVIIPSNNTA